MPWLWASTSHTAKTFRFSLPVYLDMYQSRQRRNPSVLSLDFGGMTKFQSMRLELTIEGAKQRILAGSQKDSMLRMLIKSKCPSPIKGYFFRSVSFGLNQDLQPDKLTCIPTS